MKWKSRDKWGAKRLTYNNCRPRVREESGCHEAEADHAISPDKVKELSHGTHAVRNI